MLVLTFTPGPGMAQHYLLSSEVRDFSLLDIQGTIRLSMDRKYHLKLNLSDNLPNNIKSAVMMMGRPDGKGRLTFSIPGRF